MRILVVDDHRNTREALALGLSHLATDVRTAGSAAAAMLELEHFACDWLVCDVRMPVMDGIELMQRVRTARPEIRVLLMTAYDVTPHERQTIADAGAVLLIKPVTADAIAARCGAATGAGG
ncbi:MAG TPA: response regulator [Vicinamibacterales bacterium]|nr:response regulator [Vicinamibacterales bacterium]